MGNKKPNKKPDFYPPRLNPGLVRWVQRLAPFFARHLYQVELQISQDCLQQLATIQDQRWLVLPNHPTFQDPIVLFLLSGRLQHPFYYLAAYEQFRGLLGWFFPQIGGYSIRRGLADRASIAQTLQLLSQPQCHLVIFAEGGCSFQNDTVMPFRLGAVQMAFQSLAKAVKRGDPLPDLYVIPVSLKYRYTGNMQPVIEKTLRRLEQKLYLSAEGDAYDRLRAIAERVLVSLERAYDLYTPALNEQSWNQRILQLKSQVLQRCEEKLSLATGPTTEAVRERVYRVLYTLEQQENTLPVKGSWGSEFIYRSMMRLLNFDAIYDGYVAANPSPERFLDTLVRLEREVCKIDQPSSKGHKQALLSIGAPVNLKDYFPAYQQNRVATIAELTEQLQQTVQDNLDRLNKAQTLPSSDR